LSLLWELPSLSPGSVKEIFEYKGKKTRKSLK